jgi:hypothetical protein
MIEDNAGVMKAIILVAYQCFSNTDFSTVFIFLHQVKVI